MLVLLSPAKTMNMLPDKHIHGSVPAFNSDAEYLAEKLKQYSVDELANLLKISPTLAKTNYERYKHFDDSDTIVKPALLAYNGSVFKAIATEDFTNLDMAYAQEHIRIISTLYGLLKPLDLIKAYRSMPYNFKIEGLSEYLQTYWKRKLTEPLLDDVEKAGGVLVNLASLDVQQALDMEKLGKRVRILTPEFRDMEHGKYEFVRTYAKIARGEMTRFIVKEKLNKVEELQKFDWGGYMFNETLSTDREYVYTRKLKK